MNEAIIVNKRVLELQDINDHQAAKFLAKRGVINKWEECNNMHFYPNADNPIAIFIFDNSKSTRKIYIYNEKNSKGVE